MQNIQKLIDILVDETGLTAELKVYLGLNGWVAKIVEDNDVLLCPAGETFLCVTGGADLADAVQALDDIVAQGFKQQALWAQ